MNDDFGFRRKDPLAPMGWGWRDPLTDRTTFPRPGFDHRGNPLCPPTFISTPGGSPVGTMYAGSNRLHAVNGSTYQVDPQRNARDDLGRSIGKIDIVGRFTPS